ncbi:hypothetical protein IE81DRAFT_65087 [Ceraceosorus guamensis]|uniref:BHLH domain-containing protein n=1 Tax=Ceraceosorus guamensis TaxID=1522189 RepID=A0A316W7Q3_9BASI|nr:hypothetical protein IE81DRAFT_65087 [Ceraceosorus guamensis]PWN43685.1 hypothetical protein IE81DRAFT_65087 [Ceraceosorus guamensis]
MDRMEHHAEGGASGAAHSSGSGSWQSSKTTTQPGAAAAFELPSMPVPYEDFQVSLDLPSSLDAADFSLLASPGFADMLPNLSGPSAFSPIPSTSALFSSLGARASMTPHAGDEGGRNGVGGLHLASAPYQDGTAGAGSASVPPSGHSMFSFDDLTSRAAEQHENKQGNLTSSLFDASESSFLDNFLGGFDSSWDFNPSLPDNMPSFADAQRLAATAGASFANSYDAANAGKYMAGGQNRPRRLRPAVSNSGSTPRGGDAVSDTTSPTGEGPEATAGAAFGRALDGWANEEMQGDDERGRGPGRKRSAAHLPHLPQHATQPYMYPPAGSIPGSALPFNLPQGFLHQPYGADGMDVDQSSAHPMTSGKKMKAEAADAEDEAQESDDGTPGGGASADAQAARKELLTDGEKRQNHILSEQRRRNHIREAFKELVELLEAGRAFGARGLGMSSGAGTGIEDEGLDDRESDDVHSSEDDDVSRAKRRKARNKRAMPGGGRGKGRGRGGSAGGGAGSKSAVLFQTVDLVRWLDGRKLGLEQQCEILERVAAGADPATLIQAPPSA